MLYAWIVGALHVVPAALWGAVAGVLVLVAFYNYARSLRIGLVSVIAPVFRLNFLVTVALGTANFCYKLGLIGGATPETLLAAQAAVFTALAIAMTALGNRRLLPPKGFWKHSGPAALVLVAAFLFLLHGLKTGQASVVVPISQMGFVVAAVLGVIVFEEGWTARKIAGLTAAVAALALLAIG